MSRNVLGVAAAAVLAAVLGLWLWMRAGDDLGEGSARPRTGSATPPATATPTPGDPQAPRLPDSPVAGSSTTSKDYTVGGIQVRDHRSGDTTPLEIPPNVHRPQARTLPPELTHAIAQEVKKVIGQCAAQLPAEARAGSPRLEGQILVGIKDHVMAVTKATMVVQGVAGDSEPTRQCIEQHSIGASTSAADQADLADYSINITFPLR